MMTPENKDVYKGKCQVTEKNKHLKQSPDVESIISCHDRKSRYYHIPEFHIMSLLKITNSLRNIWNVILTFLVLPEVMGWAQV